MNKIENATSELLTALGVNLEDENFADTPRRVAAYFTEHFRSEGEIKEALESFRKAVFPSNYSGMVVLTDVEVFGLCPHHLLPVLYKVDIGYIPSELVIGLSKLARLAELCFCQPLLQESATVTLADMLSSMLDTKHVAVFAHGQHLCMSIRGVKKDATTVTSELRGAFYDEESTRKEFLELAHRTH